MSKSNSRGLGTSLAALSMLLVAGCGQDEPSQSQSQPSQEGPAERMGKQIDQGMQQVQANLDNAMERARADLATAADQAAKRLEAASDSLQTDDEGSPPKD